MKNEHFAANAVSLERLKRLICSPFDCTHPQLSIAGLRTQFGWLEVGSGTFADNIEKCYFEGVFVALDWQME